MKLKGVGVAYLLLEHEVLWADPKFHGVTFSKATAEAWEAKAPVSHKCSRWNTYVKLRIVNGEKEADEIFELLKKTLDEEYRDTVRQLTKSIEEGKDFLRRIKDGGQLEAQEQQDAL